MGAGGSGRRGTAGGRRRGALRLRLAGFQVLTAADGEGGLQLIRAERPRVALVDLMMPRKHGFAVTGEEYIEAGIPHRDMELQLNTPRHKPSREIG